MNYATAAPATLFNHLFTPDMLAEKLPNGETVAAFSGQLINRIRQIQKKDPEALRFIATVRDKYATIEGRQGVESNWVEVKMHQGLERLTPSRWMQERQGCVAKLAYLLDSKTDLRAERADFWKAQFTRGAMIIGATAASIAGLAAIQFMSPELQDAHWLLKPVKDMAEPLMEQAWKLSVIAAGAVAIANFGWAHRRGVQGVVKFAGKVDVIAPGADFVGKPVGASPLATAFGLVAGAAVSGAAIVRAGVDTIAEKRPQWRPTQSPVVRELAHAWGRDRHKNEPIGRKRDRVGDLMERLLGDLERQQTVAGGERGLTKFTRKAIGGWVDSTGDPELKERFERLMDPATPKAMSKLSL